MFFPPFERNSQKFDERSEKTFQTTTKTTNNDK